MNEIEYAGRKYRVNIEGISIGEFLRVIDPNPEDNILHGRVVTDFFVRCVNSEDLYHAPLAHFPYIMGELVRFIIESSFPAKSLEREVDEILNRKDNDKL